MPITHPPTRWVSTRRRAFRLLAGGMAVALLSACGGLLPRSHQSVNVTWPNFAAAKAAFDRIEPNTTTVADLAALGFDPYTSPNTTILTYLDLIKYFMPNPSIGLENLDPAVRDCISARDACRGFRITAGEKHSKRHGNVVADLFNFRRRATQSGWQFTALLLAQGERITYKLWGGQPMLDGETDRRNPLGPLQSMDDVLPALVQ
jgi:hypothetical protein